MCDISPGKESSETGLNPSPRKRKRPVTDKYDKVSKRLHNEHSEFSSDLQEMPGQNELHNAYPTNRCIPHHLIELMYQLDLSVLCSIREYIYKHKYPSLSLAFGDSQIAKFSNIVLRYKKKSIHIQVENVNNYVDNNISYARLFNKERRSSSINSYFDSFVKYLISKSDSLYNVEYLTVYTNSGLDLTENKESKQRRSKNFYPFKFHSMDINEYKILKDFLFTSNNRQGSGFYQFSRDKTTREELLKRLEFSPAVLKIIKKRELSQEFLNEIKEEFLDKLVFAVKQPNREELNRIIRSKMIKFSEAQDNDDYITLQERILTNLEEHNKLGNYISGITYEFNILMLFLHDTFLRKNMFSINFEEKNRDISNHITINYKARISYLKAYNIDSSIDYSQLFPSRQQNNTFSVDKLFSLFVEKLGEDIRYFIIYTNSALDLTEENELKKGQSIDFYPLKFDFIDIRKKKYKILRDSSCIDGNSLYQFSHKETTRKNLLSLLKLPPSLQKERGLSQEFEKETKETFLNKLLFVVNQPDRKKLNNIIRAKVDNQSNIPYNYEELHEIALRWLESHELGPVRKGIIEKLLEDIKNDRPSYQEIQNKEIYEEFKFAKSVVCREGTPMFYQFLGFLVKGEGRKCLEVLKRQGINLTNISSILHGAGDSAIKAFKDLYEIWFDGKGNKTKYLKTLEKNGINVVNISSILHAARANAAKAFKDLYDLWFNEQGNKTQYLRTLEENEINLTNMSSILSGAGVNAAKAFKDLYNLWFDDQGNKNQCLITLEKERINLPNMSSILGGAGTNAAKAFKDLYDLWFDRKGNKVRYLKTLEENEVNLSNASGILHRAGANAAKAFKDLYDLWFNGEGNKKQCLKTLEENRINLANMSSILGGAGANAAKAFKVLFDLWFDEKENKTKYLKTLEKNRVNLANMSSILGGAGANAAKAFKELYDLWFDRTGNKTQYLKTLEREEIDLSSISSILHVAGNSAAKAFKDLYNLWFDEEGNKTQYLKILEKEKINLSTVNSILHGVGTDAAKAFKDLYDILFDEQGNRTQCLKNFTEKKDGEKSFTIRNLSCILGGTGAKIKDTFEKLHNVCFNAKGEKTELLNNFYNAGFKPRNLSCMMCGAGARASSILKKLHNACFNEKGEKTKLLKDFFDRGGFRPCDLCNILSGAAGDLQKFHDFCFKGETRKYLNHFLIEKEGFKLSYLCNILHGAEAHVCSALKDFHDICFDDKGNKTQLLDDFYEIGFGPSDLSGILSMAGNNATSVLRNFHKSCFNKENYLNHFLSEKELFTSKDLSRMLYGVGTKICPIFEKLHDLCFDKRGNKTKYLKDLVNKGHKKNGLCELLRKAVRAPSTFLDDEE